MNTFQVIRPFPGYEIGAVLSDSDFATPQRATQLVDARYLTRLVDTLAQQPTPQMLNDATIRKLTAILPDVAESGVIEAAIKAETRDTAIKALEKRLSEIKTDEHNN